MCEATALPARPRGSKHMFRNGKQQKERSGDHTVATLKLDPFSQNQTILSLRIITSDFTEQEAIRDF